MRDLVCPCSHPECDECGPELRLSKKQRRKARIRELEQQLAEAQGATEGARTRGDKAEAARADMLDSLAGAGFVHTSTALPRDRERLLAHGLAPLALAAPSRIIVSRTAFEFGVALRAEFRLTDAEAQAASNWVNR